VAPEMTPPCASLTLPATVPVASCAESGTTPKPTQRITLKMAAIVFGVGPSPSRFDRHDLDAIERVALDRQVLFACRHLIQFENVGNDRRRVFPAQCARHVGGHRLADPVAKLCHTMAC